MSFLYLDRWISKTTVRIPQIFNKSSVYKDILPTEGHLLLDTLTETRTWYKVAHRIRYFLTSSLPSSFFHVSSDVLLSSFSVSAEAITLTVENALWCLLLLGVNAPPLYGSRCDDIDVIWALLSVLRFSLLDVQKLLIIRSCVSRWSTYVRGSGSS